MEFWQWCLPIYYVIPAECRPGISIPPESAGITGTEWHPEWTGTESGEVSNEILMY